MASKPFLQNSENGTINSSVKDLVESAPLEVVPSQYTFHIDPKGAGSDSIPVIDYSLLVDGTPDQRSKVLQDLARACEEWGFFVLVNHGIPETLLKNTIDTSLQYFELPYEEKKKYEAKSISDPIKSGSTSHLNTANDMIHFWRDYLKFYVHPEFYCPDKPQALRDIVLEYSQRTQVVLQKLLRAISENLGLEAENIDKALKMESCYRLYAANYYPPCPQPDQAIGIPAHTDYGLLTFLIHNGVAGLQILHNGEWYNTDSPVNSILINTGDHLEIFSNGRYKSVKHRAVVNADTTRISVVVANGAKPDVIVDPAPELVKRDGGPLYKSMKFIEYVETELGSRILGQTNIDRIKIQ